MPTSPESTLSRIVLNSRPVGAPTPADFRLETVPMPTPAAGELLLRTLYFSLDPYMRGRMSDAPSYAAPTAIGAVMPGGAVSRVVASRHDGHAVGDLVLGYTGWQDHVLSDGTGLTRLPNDMARPSLALGALGMPGLTAYAGLLDIGQPRAGETVVVAAASGAVGSLVGQIAKVHGCHVVGIAGGDAKCRHVREELGFDACLDRRADGWARQLATACPRGIDVYFENVGGAVFDAVLPLLNPRARVPVCGLIAHYNDTALPPGPDRLGLLMGTLLRKRIRMQGFIVFDDFGHRIDACQQAMRGWLADGSVVAREDVVDGLAQAPEAFIGLLQGRNFGKLVVRMTEDE